MAGVQRVTHQELVAEVARLFEIPRRQEDDLDAFEMAQELGCGRLAAEHRLNRLVKQGTHVSLLVLKESGKWIRVWRKKEVNQDATAK